MKNAKEQHVKNNDFTSPDKDADKTGRDDNAEKIGGQTGSKPNPTTTANDNTATKPKEGIFPSEPTPNK